MHVQALSTEIEMGTIVEDARAAYARRDWPGARELYEAALRAGNLPADDLYWLSDAAWWLGDEALALEMCERALRAYLNTGESRRAAIAALDLAAANFLRGAKNEASGWLQRAGRLLEGEPISAAYGYLLYLTEVEGPLGDGTALEPAGEEALLAAAQRVAELGRLHGDAALVAAGSVGEGRVLIRMGEVGAGLARLDEVLLVARSDALHPVWTGHLYCKLIEAAEALGDLSRAEAWTDAMTRWLEAMPAAVVYSAVCGIHRSRVHQRHGAWDEAEREAARICLEVGPLHVAATATAHYQVGEIRRLRGDFQGAEAAYAQAHALGRDPQPGLALLRLAQKRGGLAAASIRTALLAERERFMRAALRAAQVEIALAADALDEARTAAGELAEIAACYGSRGLELAARYARGAILLAEGEPAAALPVLRNACRDLSEARAPYDCARVRVLLVRGYRVLGDADAAERELDAAIATFERLGAAVDLREALRLRGRPALPGGLTPREVEVLGLVAAGRSNKGIARALALSDRTVARHLANIFAKLGVSSRTSAAAFAFEHGLTHTRRDVTVAGGVPDPGSRGQF